MNTRKIYWKYTLILFVVMLTFLTGCQNKANQPVTYSDFYFNTVINLTFYTDEDAQYAEECFDLCEKYENMLSRTVEGSDIYNINHSNGTAVTVSEETYTLLQEALSYCELTQGKIDITIAPLMDAWNFTDTTYEQIPPDAKELSSLLTHVDYTTVKLGPNHTVTLQDPNAAIDLGFIAKGYIADRLKEYLTTQGVECALINLGGNISAIGSKPDGSNYTIGIQDPASLQGTPITTVSVSDLSVVTSGTYERCYTYEGVDYHHILDASTGYPVRNSLTSVTILCESSTMADALSTTCFVLGFEDALPYIRSLNNVECILIDTDNHLYYSYQ